MKKNRSIIILLIILIVLAAVAYYLFVSTNEAADDSANVLNDDPVLPQAVQEAVDLPAPSADSGAYNSAFDYRMLDQYTHNIIFFHASWCPTCRSLDADINANFDQIPIETAIYKVDYDSVMDLREKYNITVQHTIISVDKAGNLLKKTAGNASLAEIVNEHL